MSGEQGPVDSVCCCQGREVRAVFCCVRYKLLTRFVTERRDEGRGEGEGLCVNGATTCNSFDPWIFRLWVKGGSPRPVRIDSTTFILDVVLCHATICS